MLERISGNDGHDEKYVVIAKNGNVALGLYLKAHRDYNREGHPYTIQGRLRAAAAPGCEATAQEVNDAFKGLPFEKFADADYGSGIIRASLTVGIFTTQQAREGLPQAIEVLNIGQRVVDFLLKEIDAQLLVFSAPEIGEIIRDEVAKQSTLKLSALKLAQKIAASDPSFAVSVDSVRLALTNDLAAATEAYNAAITQANTVADETAKALVAGHAEANPDFTFYTAEPGGQEFMLASFLYPTEGCFDEDCEGCDDGCEFCDEDDNGGYDA